MIQVKTKNAPDTRHKTELLECLDHANPLDNKYTRPCYLHLPIGQRDKLHSCLMFWFQIFQLRNLGRARYLTKERQRKRGSSQVNQDLLLEDKIQWHSLRTQFDLAQGLQTDPHHTEHT